MKFSIVIPVNNESKNIVNLSREISSVLGQKHDYEIVFVDDGSDDDTSTILQYLNSEDNRIRFVCHSRRYGQSTALLTGVKTAVNPVIVTLDGDGQNDPHDIEKLLEAYDALTNDRKKVLITGFRHSRRDTRWRKFSSKLANSVRGRILHDDTIDTGCGIKLLPKDLFLSLPYFAHMHRFLPALVKRVGGVTISVDVNHRFRKQGHTHYGTFDRLVAGIIDMIGVMWLIKRSRIPEIKKVDLSSG